MTVKAPLKASQIMARVDRAESYYEDWYAQQDATNRSYVRGSFWANRTDLERSTSEVQPMSPMATALAYQAQQNEIWPAVESKVTLLVPDMPACSFQDLREGASSPDGNPQNSAGAGRRRASVLNYWCRMDHLRGTLTKWIQSAITYNRGGVLKVEWDADQQRPIVRERMPWEVLWDPSARHMDDIGWYFERIDLELEEFQARMDNGEYVSTPELRRVKGQAQHQGKIELYQDDSLQRQKERNLEEIWVPIIEFWDCRHRKVYHVHPETRTVLMCRETAVPRPYVHLLFNLEPGRLEGVSDVTHAAPDQQQINEMVSARQDCVRRLAPRPMGDASIFDSEDKQKQFENSKMTSISWVNPPEGSGRSIQDYFWVFPAVQLPNDWNMHYDQTVQHIRYLMAIPDFQRGQVANIRTAQEAYMLQQASTGRLAAQAATLKVAVIELFEVMDEYLKWAVEAAALDLAVLLPKISTAMVDVAAWGEELRQFQGMLTVNAFSPLMEDPITVQSKLEQLLPAIASYPPLAAAYSWYDVAQEIARAHGWEKSVVVPREEWTRLAQAAQTPPPGAPPAEAPPEGAPPEGVPPEGAVPPIPPELLTLLGGAEGAPPAQA